ncbi:MAG: hypothetical protein KIS73_23870 [Enhydrobacter sp.]|nr:hypothetical protein [Enhydrobacter sp.]
MAVVDRGPLRIASPSVKCVLCELLLSFVEVPAGNGERKHGAKRNIARSRKSG